MTPMADYDDHDEVENREVDTEAEPTEYECNECGWRGCPSSCITICGGETREELCCPRCRKCTEISEWNVVGADPLEEPLMATEAGESIGPFEPPAPPRIAAVAEGPQQGGLFQEVA
jgi:hypothetical protein